MELSNAKVLPERVFGLDIVRSIAIIMVVLSHSLWLLKPLERYHLFGKIFPVMVGLFPLFGMLGVDLFFALSGFLIGNILIKIYLNSQVFDFKVLRLFWIRRWFRTLPNYYLVLLLNVILASRFIGSKMLIKFVFFLQNLFAEAPDFFKGMVLFNLATGVVYRK